MSTTLQKEASETLKTLVETLHDSNKGFLQVGEHIKDPAAKEFFLKESLTRQQFAGEFESELDHLGDHDYNKIGGTAAGALHRTWGDFKAHLGGSDHTLLETAESGEDVIKKAYAKALETDLPGDIRSIITRQQAHIQASHDKVKAMRDSTAS